MLPVHNHYSYSEGSAVTYLKTEVMILMIAIGKTCKRQLLQQCYSNPDSRIILWSIGQPHEIANQLNQAAILY